MAMTLDIAIKNIERTLPSIAFSDSWKCIKAHLSAQAKVRVTDEDVERAKRRLYAASGEEVADWALRKVLEDFAARLSQGAQGEAELSPHPWRWRDGAPPHPWSDEWFLAETVYGDRVVLKALSSEYSYDFKTADETYIKSDKIKRWAQFPDSDFVEQKDEPAERAAVPDGWKISEDTGRGFITIADPKGETVHIGYLPQGSQVATTMLRDLAVALLTAAPQPPEGARVVDGWQPIETAPKDGRTVIVGRDMGDFGFVKGTAYYEGRPGSFVSGWIARGFIDPPGELGLAHPTHWMPLPAAPTLAGKEG